MRNLQYHVEQAKFHHSPFLVLESQCQSDVRESLAQPDMLESLAQPDVLESLCQPDRQESLAQPDVLESLCHQKLVLLGTLVFHLLILGTVQTL